METITITKFELMAIVFISTIIGRVLTDLIDNDWKGLK